MTEPDGRRRANPKRKLSNSYTTETYRRAVHRACTAAGVPTWSPNQLRHTGLTNAARSNCRTALYKPVIRDFHGCALDFAALAS
ncbi:MAG: hypothetical protein CSA62_07920 [Planctomycetota bacterium]|nr:MAG: hypothetical protein CSA62_07920 [Planctomycetota bacterium]